MKDLHVSWEEYRRLIETLAFNVYDSGWKFDSLLCLARGGLRPGDILSRIFDMPLNILSTSSYREAAGTIQGSLDIGKYIASSRPDSLKGRVLLVDDLVDSGLTLKKVVLSFLPFRLFALPQNIVYVLFDNVVFLDLFFQLAIISVKGFFLRL